MSYEKLPTDHTFFSLAFSSAACADYLNEIIGASDGKKSSASDFSFGPKLCKTVKRMNDELQRRGIQYRISKCFGSSASIALYLMIIPAFIEMSQIAKALNLLSADYNERG